MLGDLTVNIFGSLPNLGTICCLRLLTVRRKKLASYLDEFIYFWFAHLYEALESWRMISLDDEISGFV
jgi:hypothetical protein